MIILFKSLPEMYKIEENGDKNNTQRVIEGFDKRKKQLDELTERGVCDGDFIEIINTKTKKKFIRQIKSVVKWQTNYIITWRT